MTLERKIRVLAGSLSLLGLGLGVLANPYFLLLPTFVGLNLIQSSFTGFCPAEGILRRLEGDPRESARGAESTR